MSTKKDMLERIADALDGGGDFGQGTVNEIGYLERIAKYFEQHGSSDSGSGDGGSSSSSDFVKITAEINDTDVILDKSFSDIEEIIANGKIPFLWDGSRMFMLTALDSMSGVIRFGTAILYGVGTTAYADDVYVYTDGAYITYMNLTVATMTPGD